MKLLAFTLPIIGVKALIGAGVRLPIYYCQLLSNKIQWDAQPRFTATGVQPLSNTLKGAGVLFPGGSTFKYITYDNAVRVLKLGGAGVKPFSLPNALLYTDISAGSKSVGDFAPTCYDDSLNIETIYFACVTNVLGTLIPVQCQIWFDGTDASILGIDKSNFAWYNNTIFEPTFVKVTLNFSNIRRLNFRPFVVNKGIIGPSLEVSLLLDSVYYTRNKKAKVPAGCKG